MPHRVRTRRRLALGLISISLAPATLAAAPRHSVGGAFDTGIHVVRDDALVPLAHAGPRVALLPRYFGDVGVGLLLADARLGAAYVRGSHGEEGLTTTWNLHAGLVFTLDAADDYGLFLGPTLGWDNETLYFGDWDDAHAYWLGTLWLGPRLHSFRRLSEGWRVDFDAQLSLVGFFARPPGYRYAKQETSNDVLAVLAWPTHGLEFGWFGDFQVVRTSLEFYRSRRRGRVPTGFGIGTELGFAHAESPDHVISTEALARVSYSWGW